ncbi:MAG TPA: glycosyltransferase family 4 protein [Burkholderiaceae bacterium]|nr:glycosyltransferase family 4 protein [Burkholderiaceae bacterium]
MNDPLAASVVPRRIAVVANTSWYLFNFRASLIRALQADGHRLFAVGGEGEFAGRLRDIGIEHRGLAFNLSGVNPIRELQSVWALRRVFRNDAIDVVLSFTPKGNIYSALALTGLPAVLVMNISGLGTAFANPGWLTRISDALYRSTLQRAHWVFFQNEDDHQQFRSRRLVGHARTSRLPGSGVDLSAFRPSAETGPTSQGEPVFLMMARMLWDKGVGEFVEAARRVKAGHPRARFRLLGALVPDHSRGVPEATLRHWVQEGVVEYLGVLDDVRPQLLQADCVVLPSYREGLPRSLLEAAASARPVIAADSVGCRDAVDDGVSGYLCRVRDVEDLARQMLRMLALSPDERRRMGEAGRAKVEREFDEGIVIDAYRQRVRALSAAYGR